MSKYVVEGGTPLNGEVRIHGSKNAVGPIIAASIMCNGESVIHDCPRLSDVHSTLKIAKQLGCDVNFNNNDLTINPDNLHSFKIPDEMMSEIRSSFIFLGALLTKSGRAEIAYPGGCEIGQRPIDIHIKALRELGFEIEDKEGIIYADARNAHSGKVHLSFPSVGATENVILASVKLKGETLITNAAKEPEISDLVRFLINAGAKIYGAGSGNILIDGVPSLRCVEHTVIPDRIVASTYMCLAMTSGGEIQLENVNTAHLDAIISTLKDCGAEIETFMDKLYIKAPKKILTPPVIKTQPYPGFPTDTQSLLLSSLLKAEGSSIIVENIFENRYKTVPELLKMGADILCEGRVAVIRGVKKLSGAHIFAPDLRGGAGLVCASLSADGESIIENIHHIKRGYEDFSENLKTLGANIREE